MPHDVGHQLVDQLRGVLDRVDHAVAVAILVLVAGARLEPQPERGFRGGRAHDCVGDARGLLFGLSGEAPGLWP